ncbi:MAG: molybdenum cofactor guanylyltransferase [Anaerolineales bacterium]
MRNFTNNQQVSIVVQAGGQSVRMGTDKGLVELRGKPLAGWIIDQTADIASETLIVSNQPEHYQRFGLPVYPDIIPGIGALGGLYTATHYARFEYIFVLACDMPFIHKAVLQYMLNRINSHDVLIPFLDDRTKLEPFRALYRKNCERPILNAIQAGKRRAISFFAEVNVQEMAFREISELDPEGISFFNINTPEDVERAEIIAASLPTGFLSS